MTVHRPSPIVFALGGPFARADLLALCERLGALLQGGDAAVAVCDVRALVAPDAVTIDALARLQLTARRAGHEVRLRHASSELQELLAFIGLNDVLRLEPKGQSEEREQRRRVEEEAELDDPTR